MGGFKECLEDLFPLHIKLRGTRPKLHAKAGTPSGFEIEYEYMSLRSDHINFHPDVRRGLGWHVLLWPAGELHRNIDQRSQD